MTEKEKQPKRKPKRESKTTWKNTPKDITPYVGMVYCITELDTGMVYFGCKKYWKTKKLPPLKGKNNKRHKLVESNWRTYNSSSPILQKKIKKNPDNYKKEILVNCKTVTDMKCIEAYAQLKTYFDGLWHMCYNEVINLRVRIRNSRKQ